jgi:hypothetical protein
LKKIILNKEPYIPEKIIGISSIYKDFQIAWSLNQIFQINLTKSSDVELNRLNIREFNFFSRFSYYNQDDFFYLLIANKNESSFLSTKYKNIDFFLITNTTFEIEIINKSISNQQFINGSFILEVDSSLKKIIFDLIH